MKIQFSNFCFGSIFSSFLLKVAKGFLVISAAPIFWVLWKTKNKSCFKCVRPGDPTTVVFLCLSVLSILGNLCRKGLFKDCCDSDPVSWNQ